MNVFTFLFLAVCAVLCARVAEIWIKQRETRSETDAELGEALEKLEMLEERIRVLERIVTEDRVDLKRQIDSL